MTRRCVSYDELDAAILTRILGGFTRFYEIWIPLENVAKPHVKDTRNGGADRVVDRRLQALKRKGKIMCKGQRWYAL